MFYSDRLLMRKIILLAGDVALFFFALFLALSIRQVRVVSADYYQINLQVFWPIFAMSVVIYFLFDLYNIKMLQKIYRSVYFLFLAVATNILLAVSFWYVFYSETEVTPKTGLLLYGALVFLLTVVWRFLYHDLFFNNSRYQKRIVIVGGEEQNEELLKIANPPQGADYKIVGYISQTAGQDSMVFQSIPYLGNFHDIQKIIREQKVEELIVAFDYRRNRECVKELSDSLNFGIKIFEWPVFFEQVFQKVPTNQIDHFWFIYGLGDADRKLYERIKRLLDMLVAVVGLIFSACVLPLVAIAVKSTSRGPIFYRQKRMGFNGKLFTLIKFRTMENQAEKNGVQWASKNDARVTMVGRFLRRTRLDEIPQFINILKGEMSLVGPRPERPEFLETLSEKIPFYYKRNMVLPGLTGFAQIMYPYAATVEDSLEKVGYDLYYIKNRSLFLYLKIVLLTVRTALSFSGR
ncbi:MAG: sugar transferase [Candidatus Moranbacteria bacterium]|nr:sugar transferase [Candidatus Moranbacteria bacterium]